jgi:hypothetical protein
MSETPESTPANEAAAESPAETKLESRLETDRVSADTVDTQIEMPFKTVETQIGIPFETVGILRDPPIELQDKTRVEVQTEARVETQAATQTETQIETQNQQQTEKQVATRPEPPAVTLIDRPFRVKLRGSVLVLIRLPNKRQLRAALHQLSTTGGVINLEKPLDEKIEVELIFHIDHSTIHGKAQMLFPMWATQGWMQPFRFVELTDTDRNALQENLQSFIGNLGKSASAAG